MAAIDLAKGMWKDHGRVPAWRYAPEYERQRYIRAAQEYLDGVPAYLAKVRAEYDAFDRPPEPGEGGERGVERIGDEVIYLSWRITPS